MNLNDHPIHLQHVNIMVDDLAAADAFYHGVLGIEHDHTPSLPQPSQFYRVGDGLQIHVNELPGDKSFRAHFALRVGDFNALLRRCVEAGVIDTEPWGLVKRIPGGMWQAFVRDPSRNLVEIASEPDADLDADLAALPIVESAS